MPLSRINNPFLSSSGADNASITSPAANVVAFTTATTERMRVTATGNFGVGTASPLARIHSTRAGAELARFTNSNSNGGDWEFKLGGGGFEDRKFMITDKYSGADNVRLSIDSAGLVTIASGQIKFPASQNASADANTLDDYEEGTFTATFSASGVTLNNANNYGYYTKIGNRVIAQIYIRCLYVSGTHADITITGFPFTSATGTYNQHGCALGYVDGFTGLTYSQIFAYIGSGTATANLLNANYQGGLVNISTSKLGGGSGAYFVATFSYQTPT
jgi:hypothetical protein